LPLLKELSCVMYSSTELQLPCPLKKRWCQHNRGEPLVVGAVHYRAMPIAAMHRAVLLAQAFTPSTAACAQ
jgi:hypothetical protein